MFGSVRSLERFVTQFRDRLLEAEALVVGGAEISVHPKRFDQFIRDVDRHPSSKRRLREARAGNQPREIPSGERLSP